MCKKKGKGEGKHYQETRMKDEQSVARITRYTCIN